MTWRNNFSPLAVEPLLSTGKFQILKHSRFHIDIENIALPLPERDNIESHFPAMQVTVNIY